jgi:hypothetical protein
MASSAGLRNNPSTGVTNNGNNNSSGTALAGRQRNPSESNNADSQEDPAEMMQRELSKAMAARDIQLRQHQTLEA